MDEEETYSESSAFHRDCSYALDDCRITKADKKRKCPRNNVDSVLAVRDDQPSDIPKRTSFYFDRFFDAPTDSDTHRIANTFIWFYRDNYDALMRLEDSKYDIKCLKEFIVQWRNSPCLFCRYCEHNLNTLSDSVSEINLK